ncbi:2-dehydro-3-deoxygalactonokinase [Sphingorhabdus sp.]|uniref:2-dehydro-3-deoxygalactonokinase n=1 Tax=Sphingorhabdus sp. TaxID=1902408 RepID=UPI00391AAFEF
MWHAKYIAVDWGTTNRRAWLIDSSGSVESEFKDHLGLMSVPKGGFDSAAADIRKQLGDYPMLLAGMVGSDRGWRQAGYVPCPADAALLAASILWVEPMRTGIIPGVCQTEGHADVMRGEEVQVLGAQAIASLSPNAIICHPGTHCKWIHLQNGRISRFQTAMTGEIFDLLKTHSILAAQMSDDVMYNASFQQGLKDARDGAPLLNALFAVRARYLLQAAPPADASYASGLLIGNDVMAGLMQAASGSHVTLIGRPDLCHLYARAIAASGCTSSFVDGGAAFRAGIDSIIRQLGE